MFENLKQTVQTLSDPKTTTKQDAEDRYERVVGGSVMALDRLAQDLPVCFPTFLTFRTKSQHMNDLLKLLALQTFGNY
jgi:hypothetical protein